MNNGLPPTLIQVAENDVLRDDGETYGRLLEQARLPVTTVRYNGVIHDWGLLNRIGRSAADQISVHPSCR
ncbi:alpha/beta hydrolase fold domain-containing protein [Dyadobacter sp. 3J3]|uniref:alpha/beta hydrolase fold domain-containing protein n=1 Tax=Dyadobacter sp. 3J3 TaxID=2606600 RepID=UPI00210327A8|nr:alpha/beta hydrolase fold domain-containing protein [Dyadobacter sp. 3J3]